MLRASAVITLIGLYVSIGACATRLDYNSPKSEDLSGQWVLNAEQSQEIILRPAKHASVSSKGERRGERSRGGRPQGAKTSQTKGQKALVADLRIRPTKPDSMTATEMAIEQVQDSMGIRYASDKYRDVDWGKKEYRGVTTVAGWEGDTLQINTKGKRLSFSESYQLNKTGDVLSIFFKVSGEQYRRVYTKQIPQ